MIEHSEAFTVVCSLILSYIEHSVLNILWDFLSSNLSKSNFHRNRVANRPCSCSEKESESNDILIHFVEFSNAHNSDGSSKATQSNTTFHDKYIKITLDLSLSLS